MAKRNRFHFKKYYPDFPVGWGLHSDKEIEEKLYWMPFLLASDHYREEFESGNQEAIFTFARICPECFREVWAFSDGTTASCYSNNNIFLRQHGRSWVLEQIEKWKAEDTPEARKKLKRFFSAYADSRGRKETPPEGYWLIYRQIKQRMGSGMTFDHAVAALIDDAANGCLDPETQLVLAKHVEDDEAGYYNTFKEIFYELKKLEKRYIEDAEVTERNLRLEYFLPHSGVTIPKKYEDQFKDECSLYSDVEWLRQGFISLPQMREGLNIYTGVRPFGEERLPLKEALERVSKEKKVSLKELKEIYIRIKHIEAMYYHDDHSDVLKEL